MDLQTIAGRLSANSPTLVTGIFGNLQSGFGMAEERS